MNETAMVALITSLSTLAAAGLTGMLASLSTGRQLRHQRALAHDEQAEQRAARHRELRREAYERFLSRADEAYRVLDEGWFAEPFTETPRWEAGFAARRALDEAYVRVMLEGPVSVAEAGAALVRSIGDEFRRHRRIVDAQPQPADQSAAELDAAERAAALEARYRSNAAFVATAREAITSEPPAGAEPPGTAR